MPFSFSLATGEMFGVAGVLEDWAIDGKESMHRFSWVQVPATILLSPSFETTPAIIQARDHNRWLYSGHVPEHARELLRPVPAVEFKRWLIMPSARL